MVIIKLIRLITASMIIDEYCDFLTESSFRDISALSGINMASSAPVGIPLFLKSPDPNAGVKKVIITYFRAYECFQRITLHVKHFRANFHHMIEYWPKLDAQV